MSHTDENRGESRTVLTAADFLRREVRQFEPNLPLFIHHIQKENQEAVRKKLADIYGGDYPLQAEADGKEVAATVSSWQEAQALWLAGGGFTARKRRNFGDLVEIVKRLREPGGCPWDREQTHASLAKNLIEEAYEFLEAIALDDTAKMLEESGDVLLQAVFHAVIAEEAGRFTPEDIVSALCEKIVSRHTHIFGENKANSPEEALRFWDEAKMKEKKQATIQDKLDAVPKSFGALMRANKVQKIIKKTGFDYPDSAGALRQLYEEIEEMQKESAPEKRAMEAGDILFAAVNVLRMEDIDPEIALNRTTEKFVRRFLYVEKKALEAGYARVDDCDVDTMERWYQEYKRLYEK